MEAPLHKLCGKRHWSGEPCPPEPVKVAVPEWRQSLVPLVAADAVNLVTRYSPAFDPARKPTFIPREPKPGFDKVAYQREYMRKRRAAKKASIQ